MTEGAKRERKKERNGPATTTSSSFLWRKQVMTMLMTKYMVKGTSEWYLRKAATKANDVVLNTTWGTKNNRAEESDGLCWRSLH